MDKHSLQEFSQAVYHKNAPIQNCWGFIDGTVRPMCRPSVNQKASYNGHKRCHALKYQAIMAPNGIIANLQGPFEEKVYTTVPECKYYHVFI